MDKLVCVQDFEHEAITNILDKNKGLYVQSGADDEVTAHENRSAYNRILIHPRMLRDVSKRDLSTKILGKRVQVPFGVCPMGFQRIMHPLGEIASAQAASSVGGVFTLSIFATTSMEEIATAVPNGRNWMQLFVHSDRSLTEKLICRAEKAGFEAIVITVDAQIVGKRRPSKRNPLVFPEHLRLPNSAPDASPQALDFDNLHSVFDYGLNWSIIRWLKRATTLPIILKGIQTAEDALLAVQEGVDAIWISNHGGRQLGSSRPTISVLPEVVEAVGKRCEIYIDSGVTRGSDIFKAIALGADMVFVGRSVIYGLVVGGVQGATKIMEILREELDLTMALSGVASIKELTTEYVGHASRL